jgi:glycosyltransferase involved in cell wall biosynthesis
MKIAIMSPWAISASSVGGTERFCKDLADGLSARGHDITVITLSGNDCVIDGVKYKSLDLLGNGRVATEYDLRERLGDFSRVIAFDKLAQFVEERTADLDFDVLHINSLLFLKIWSSRRRVFTIHTNPYEYVLDWGEEGYRRMLQILSEEATHLTTFIAPSQHYATLFSERANCSVIYIPHALNISRLLTKTPSSYLKNKLGLNTKKITLLLPSRLEALAKLAVSDRNKVQVVASGVDPQYQSFCAQLQSIANEVKFDAYFKRFDNMAEAYAAADIVGLPSCSESFGYSALESLALGKPTILNDIPTYLEIGAGNPNAYFFHDNADSFKERLSEILHNGIVSKMTPEDWKRRYDIEGWISRYEDIMA